MNQKHVHQYVLEHITGVPESLRYSNKAARIGAYLSLAAALLVFAYTLTFRYDFEAGMRFTLSALLAGFPFAILAQRFTSRTVLDRQNLRVTRFVIGKKEYLVPRNHAINHDLDMFAAAANLVSTTPELEPIRHAAAWHTARTIESIPGVAVTLGWFGHHGQSYAFIYGEYSSVTKMADEVWDLGHVRMKSEADEVLYAKTAAAWKKKSEIPVAIAYAPISKDVSVDNIGLHDISEVTLLGLLNLHSTRERGSTFTPQLSRSIRNTATLSLITTLSLLVIILVGFGTGIFNTGVAIHPLHILSISAGIVPLLLASMSWDHFRSTGRTIRSKIPTNDILFATGLLAAVTILQYIWLLGRRNIGGEGSLGDIYYQEGLALAFGTYAACLLIEIILQRIGGLTLRRDRWLNPFFLLSLASSILILLIGAYATGPLASTDLLYLAGAGLVYLAIRGLHTYANTHHTREHILSLLGQD